MRLIVSAVTWEPFEKPLRSLSHSEGTLLGPNARDKPQTKNRLERNRRAWEMEIKDGDASRCRSSFRAFAGHLSKRFSVRSPLPPPMPPIHLAPFRTQRDDGVRCGHVAACGMRMRDGVFVQASPRLPPASPSPKSGVDQHPPSEFPPPTRGMACACSMARHGP